MQSNRGPVISLFGMLALVPVVLGATCSVLGVDSYDDDREHLAAARSAWEAQETPRYSYVLQRLCFCGGGTTPATVLIQSGERVSVTDVQTGEAVPAEFQQYYLTIDELFDFIEDAIDRKAHRIAVTYDAEHGYPTDISIDYDENAVDEEMAFQLTAFTVLP